MSVTLDNDETDAVGLRPDGRPDQEYAAALGLIPASPMRRSLAFAIDFAIWLALFVPGVLATVPVWSRLPLGLTTYWLRDHPAFSGAAVGFGVSQGLVLASVLVQLILHGRKGITVGKAIFGLRSVSVAGFGRPGFRRIVLRAAVFLAAALVIPVLGAVPLLLSPLWDKERRGRGWLDVIGGTWLLDVRAGLDPVNTKQLRHARKAVTAAPAAAHTRMPSLATRRDESDGAVEAFVPGQRSRSGVVAGPAAEPSTPVAPVPGTPAPAAAPIGLAPAAHAPLAPAPAAPPVARTAPPAAPAPAAPAPAAPAPATPAPARTTRATLVFDDGTRLDVVGSGLIGRNPAPGPGEDVTHLLPVADDSRLISKTHAAFGLDQRGFWVSDCGSTNGTTVESGVGAATDLTPWERSHVAAGSTVTVGGRRFTVETVS
ncbi:FHA domain-containing protein [Cryobacterium sp. TMT1-21]|uniref:RDD family protein n=1 Tax=Cryobacterium sp. TMT1-21 TaxID=1259234 RepID=UPI00106D713A|nr:RDD family protein [Cryobacterium sp. TMT1-21]TFD15314.1 FHA domain-containing protein [Cryobacterium sp. TMT1-21]